MAGAIPGRERVFSCEEVSELRLSAPDRVAIRIRSVNLEGPSRSRGIAAAGKPPFDPIGVLHRPVGLRVTPQELYGFLLETL
jgi:hypothetical protein